MCVPACVWVCVCVCTCGAGSEHLCPQRQRCRQGRKKWDGGGQKEAKSTKSVERRSRQRQRLRAPATTTINWQSVHWKNNCTDITHTHTHKHLDKSGRYFALSQALSKTVWPCCSRKCIGVAVQQTLSLSHDRKRARVVALSRSLAQHYKKPILLLKCLRLCLSFVFGFLLGSHLVLIV